MVIIQIGYRRKERVEMVESPYVSEDQKYLILESGKYVKSRIVHMQTVKAPVIVDDEE